MISIINSESLVWLCQWVEALSSFTCSKSRDLQIFIELLASG